MRPLLCATLLLPLVPCAQVPGFLAPDKRVVFLGDSNTAAGTYVALVEARLRLALGGSVPQILNLGLPSETCSGLSEPDHPFPRPDVHERLDRVLAMCRPDAVVACYGMNDGIYHPLDEARFARYRQGLRRLVERVGEEGIPLVLLTPPAFDPLPLRDRDRLVPRTGGNFSFITVYEGYASVMQTYADWVGTLEDGVDQVIDVHDPQRDHLAAMRRSEPGYAMSGDGVHFDRRGHRIVAEEILKGWGVSVEGEIPEELERLCIERNKLLHAAWLTHVGHRRPSMRRGMPLGAAHARAVRLERRMRALVGAGREGD